MKSSYQKIVDILGEDRVKKNQLLSTYTTFKIGGSTDLFFVAKTTKQLVKAVITARETGVPFFLLGGGSNILVSDRGFQGLVIKNEACKVSLVEDHVIRADSGIKNVHLVDFAQGSGLTGLEFLYGIPGTLGGAIKHNAHFRDPRSFSESVYDFQQVHNLFIGDFVKRVKILAEDNQVSTKNQGYCQFRNEGFGPRSIFAKNKDIILGADLKVSRGDPQAIKTTIKNFLQWRKSRKIMGREGGAIEQPADPITGRRPFQPIGFSAGCIFANIKNPGNHPSGRVIDMCGLRGKRIGGAIIAKEHANFILNVDQAKASDVVSLINLCKKEVKKKFGVELVEEIVYVGEFEKNKP